MYFRRIGAMDQKEKLPGNSNSAAGTGTEDQLIAERLQKLKEGRNITSTSTTDDDIKSRLQNIKGETPSASDSEIYARLAKLKGVPIEVVSAKVSLLNHKVFDKHIFGTFLLITLFYSSQYYHLQIQGQNKSKQMTY